MKKNFMKITLALFLFVTSLSSFSQSTYVGINAGFGKTWYNNLYPSYENRDFSFQTYGVSILRTTKSQHFGYGADLNYSFEGAKMHAEFGGTSPSSYDQVDRVNYLRLPLKAYYFFGKSSSVIRPKVYLAPTLGYVLHASEKGNISFPGGSDSYEENITSKFDQKFDFGFQGGVGFNLRLSNKIIVSTDLNYYKGLINTWADTRKNGNASVNLGVLWNIGKK